MTTSNKTQSLNSREDTGTLPSPTAQPVSADREALVVVFAIRTSDLQQAIKLRAPGDRVAEAHQRELDWIKAHVLPKLAALRAPAQGDVVREALERLEFLHRHGLQLDSNDVRIIRAGLGDQA